MHLNYPRPPLWKIIQNNHKRKQNKSLLLMGWSAGARSVMVTHKCLWGNRNETYSTASSCCHASAATLLDSEVPAHVPALLLVEDKNGANDCLYCSLKSIYTEYKTMCAERTVTERGRCARSPHKHDVRALTNRRCDKQNALLQHPPQSVGSLGRRTDWSGTPGTLR